MISFLGVYLKLFFGLGTPLILMLDKKYKLFPEELFPRILARCRGPYLREVQDCDDFAWRLKAEANYLKENGVGFVIGWKGGLHCWNVAVTPRGVFQIEPQTREIFGHGKGYHPLLVII